MDKVKAQYERWIYPEPIEDMEAWLAGSRFSIGDARECGDIFWPATGYREGMNILVAGLYLNQPFLEQVLLRVHLILIKL